MRGSDGLLDYFALELSDSERSSINAHFDLETMQESEFDMEMPDTGQEDPDLNGASYATEPLNSTPNVGARGFRHQRSKASGLFKRIPLQSWAEKITSWSLAIISLVPNLSLPNHEQTNNIYPYYFVNTIDPDITVRVYDLDTGLNMQHPEFNGRLKPDITREQTQDDWDIDWLFPRVDNNEFFYAPDSRGQLVRR